MLKRTGLTVCAFALSILLASCNNGLSEGADKPFIASDVTAGIENLGNIKDIVSVGKAPRYAYARNIWDMQVFDGKIFLGYGCWSNYSSSGAVNAGPLPILALDTSTDRIAIEEVYDSVTRKPEQVNGVYAANDEQLWRFRVIDGTLYAPGCDAKEDWDFGNFYVRQQDGTWLKKRTVPGGVHVLDFAGFNGKLYAARNNMIMSSDDLGDTWQAVTWAPNRADTLIPWKDALYGFGGGIKNNSAIYTIKIDKTTNAVTRGITVVADSRSDYYYKMIKTHASIGGILAFTVGSDESNEGFNIGEMEGYDVPDGLYYTRDFPNDNTKAVFPESRAEPIDILERGNQAYVLVNIENGPNDFTVMVYQTTNVETFTECFRFDSGTFARSFEEYGGNFYFGMGTMDEAVSELSGAIIKVPYDVSHR